VVYYTYVLFSLKDKRFYIGFTRNIDRRLIDHNNGKNLSTRTRRPFKLIYYEYHLAKSDALRREKYFKTSKGKSSLRQMIRDSLVSFKLRRK